jgi:hypothetical protein
MKKDFPRIRTVLKRVGRERKDVQVVFRYEGPQLSNGDGKQGVLRPFRARNDLSFKP